MNRSFMTNLVRSLFYSLLILLALLGMCYLLWVLLGSIGILQTLLSKVGVRALSFLLIKIGFSGSIVLAVALALRALISAEEERVMTMMPSGPDQLEEAVKEGKNRLFQERFMQNPEQILQEMEEDKKTSAYQRKLESFERDRPT
ncbi:hypothetical protein OROGR_034168 [Orobanche gracilis]